MNISGAERSDAMKTYKSPAEILADIELVFASNRPCAYRSPLDAVLESLHSGRHYSWAGIYIAVDGKARRRRRLRITRRDTLPWRRRARRF